jgi:hypothetical protein
MLHQLWIAKFKTFKDILPCRFSNLRLVWIPIVIPNIAFSLERQFLPIFKRIILEMRCRFFHSMNLCAQRLALPAAGGTRLAHETDKNPKSRKRLKNGANPAVRVHAWLATVFLLGFLGRKNFICDFAFNQLCCNDA